MYRNSSVSQNYESYLNSSFTDVFYLDSIYIEREDNNSYDYNIPIQPCLQSDWDKFQDKNEDRIIINNKSFFPTCFNLTGLNKLNRTFFEESQGNTVSIKLKINFNSSYYKQNKEKVTNIINEMLFKVELYTFNKLIDYDSNIIYKKIEKSFYSYIDLKFTQFFDVYFQEFFFYKDYNLLLKNPIESEGVKYSWVDHGLAPANQRLERLENNPPMGILQIYNFKIDPSREEIYITIKKFPQFLSEVSSIVTSSLIIFKMIFSHFNFLTPSNI